MISRRQDPRKNKGRVREGGGQRQQLTLSASDWLSDIVDDADGASPKQKGFRSISGARQRSELVAGTENSDGEERWRGRGKRKAITPGREAGRKRV